MLAHTNKNLGDDGKLVFAGTSDIVDDVDEIKIEYIEQEFLDAIKAKSLKEGDYTGEAVLVYTGYNGFNDEWEITDISFTEIIMSDEEAPTDFPF
jgi:hypothetical protein